MNNDCALIAQLHKCVGETQTSLTNTLKKQIQEFIKTAQTPQTPQTAKPYYFKVGEKRHANLLHYEKH